MIRRSVCTAAAFLALASPAVAGSRAQLTVSYRDLNLANRADVRLFVARLDHAATAVCGGNPDKERYASDTPMRQREFEKCRSAAIVAAANAVGAPLVLQAIAERHGTVPMRTSNR